MPLYMVALRRAPRRVGIAFGASALTHPVVWFVMPVLFYSNAVVSVVRFDLVYPLMVAVAESFAIGVEAFYLHRFGVRRAWAWALGANLASATIGLASRTLWGWP